ncbi:OmpA/MotB family protein [Cesiribacter andamanensis]|uniref:Inner membrane lipoprotein YiaD n=1 Tax=Cesiribacter andamanensis AMV16 TaxID=1279009 RepID=M7N9F8_9BACT|nr:OmpA family protein [Cesiribacter andamanensis]EMR03897.1 Inner membrane lipoprotein YiaD precursor [Cesiribacter andamanensis AMV16]
MFKKTIPLYLLMAAAATGCVSQKKYDTLLAEKVRLEALQTECEEKLAVANSGIQRLEQQRSELEAERSKLQQELGQTSQDLQARQKAYKELEDYYNNLVNTSGKLQGDLSEQQKRLISAREELEATRRRNEELATNLQERERRVNELEKLIAEKERVVSQLRQKVSDALLNFKENDLTVEVRNGKVYVSLAEQLLFKSGSTQVDPKGQKALQQLAGVLKDSRDINILVEGHTDNVPMNKATACISDNWDLSVLRATSIVNILQKSGVGPDRITAAGRGEFVPVTANTTADGRAKNRRTEIILTPKLDELFQLLESN